MEVIDAMVASYDKPILAIVRQQLPEVVVFDMDNRSDASIIGYAGKILEDAQQAVIIIEAKEGQTGTFISFLEKVIRFREKCLVLFNGNNQLIERMLTLLDKQQLKKDLSIQNQQAAITEFLAVH